MTDTHTTLLQRLQTAAEKTDTGFSPVSFTREELIQLVHALSVTAAAPVAALLITTCESGAVSHAIHYDWNADDKQLTEQQGGHYIALYRHDTPSDL
ncbi:hypothetical protein [Morganella psychrotolerans]|uniref:hypothetical protein n=1 Tax=Morganella psychrotolerans TaxID=368603 RepID=UPI0039B05465